LAYQWAEDLKDEEAKNLGKRAIAFVCCAIHDAAIHSGLNCRPSEIPNGLRPAWILEGGNVPVSLTVSDIDPSDKTCQLTIDDMVFFMSKSPGEQNRWRRLLEGFKAKFKEITV
jgi:hypothetical protein